MKGFRSLYFGKLPAPIIRRYLKQKVSMGRTRLRKRAHAHIAQKHPKDYPAILSFINPVLREPHFIGQSPHHPNEFEIIRKIDGRYFLVAINLIPDRRGHYE